VADDVVADAAFAGGAGAGGDDDVGGFEVLDLWDRNFVVAEDLDPPAGPDLAELLDEVVGERVVIIDENDHGGSIAADSRRKKTAATGSVAAAGYGVPTRGF
jgi:hypothetical protein